MSLAAQDRVILTGLLDGTAPGAKPRAIELYVDGTVDLGDYVIQRYANTGTEPTGIALSGTYTDAFVYVVNGTDEFAQAFGTAGDFANIISSGTVSGNGNDAFALSRNGTILDQVGGEIGDDTDLYTDSYLYRTDNTGPDGGWVAANWTIPGNDVLDNKSLAEIGALVPFGSYRVGAVGPSVAVSPTADLGEPEKNGAFTLTLSEPAAQSVTITYELGGTAVAGTDFTDPQSGSVDIPAGTLSVPVNLTVIDDKTIEGTETIELTVTAVTDARYATGATATLSLTDDDLGSDPIGIHLVQGTTDVSPLAGNTVTVQAVVVGDFQAGLGGFYLQEEDADADLDSLTSEGIFVFASSPDVNIGDLVTVTAVVEERFNQTQLRGGDAGAMITIEAVNVGMPTAVNLALPSSDDRLEAFEGMRVSPVNMVITSVDGLERFGEIEVTSDERLVQFTECNEPNATALAAFIATQENDVVVIDDGRSGTNLRPILLPTGDPLSARTEFRAGQRISGLTGVLGYGFNRYRIQPTETDRVTLSGNERPTDAPDVGGNLRVVSANVLNYFTTLGSRGADTEGELQRQEAKIVAAMCALEADIIGLIEIENNDNVALARLVDSLSVHCGSRYRYVVSPNPGEDQIMVALVYRSDRVEESGTAAALATPASLFVGPGTNRVPLAQTFRVIDSTSPSFGETLTVCVNHLKSKGSGCGDGDDDSGGAGNCNGTRTGAARAITEWLATDPTGSEDSDVLIIGDLNSYRMEDPIDVFLQAGYQNTKTLVGDGKFPCGGGPPSYVFGGRWGSLDYALASPSLARHITGATAWTVNAPEPEILDYNTEDGGAHIYAADFYRFSDHDPIVVGIDLGQIVNKVPNGAGTASPVELQRSGESSYTFVNMVRRSEYLITNAAGQVLHRGVATPLAGTISTVGLPAGIYFVVLREPGVEIATFKVFK
ncbi:hypothetical protein GGR28_001908 [Lewinella aquimaris]|uniref:Endonuclease/exonuclease/phosphatase domain-containing protein n=1 Tax=Neolewinella aquimaris TaxID=1835722 RepID=A0A840EBA1_9BACT|nr:ExeM/NucH family extracellular endonuclease [Neolewinella aquimaris]MBB4079288.1 hypothetical protein [Neolewinella aquimaris]